MATFKPKQKVAVKYGKDMRIGIIQSLLKSGKFKIKLDDGSVDTVSPNLIVDYDAYIKTINVKETASSDVKKSTLKKQGTKKSKIDDDLDNDLDTEELDWGDLEEDKLDEDDDDELEAEFDDGENELEEDELEEDLDEDELEEDELEEDLDEDELEEELDEDLDEDELEEELDDDLDIKSSKTSNESDDIGDNWFGIGDEDDEKFSNLPNVNIRFWLQRGTSTKVTIITPKPVTYREHRAKVDGKPYFLTCLATTGVRCPLCEIGNRATPKKAFYVIDHTEYFSKKKNKKVKHSLRIWVLGTKQYELLKTATEKYFKGEKNFTYRGLTVEITRSNDKMAYNSGDYFFIEGVIKKDIFKGDYDKSINDLVNVLKPLDPKLLRSKLSSIETEDYDY